MNEIKAQAARLPLRLPRLNDVTPSAALFLAARASTIGMLPFGIAFFAAVSDKSTAYLGVAAVCLGIISTAGLAAVPKYLIALILYWLFLKLYKSNKTHTYAAACGGALFIGGAAMLPVHFNGIYDLFFLTTESIITALMYIVFKKSGIMSGGMSGTAEEYVSTAVAVSVVISGTNGIGLGPLHLCQILSAYILLITALNASVSAAGCAGLCIGFMSSMSSSASLVMMGIYGMSAVFAAFLNSYKKAGCAIGFICGCAVTFIYAKNIFDIPVNFFDVLASVLLFIITPGVVHQYFHNFFEKASRIETVNPELRMKEYLSMRLNKTGEAFGSLYESFVAVSEGRLKKYSDDIGIILDETTDRVCRGCNMCGKCWQTDFRRTYKNVLELIGIIEAQGRLTRDNLPPHFCERCIRTDEFIYEINHVYELFRREVLRRSDAVTTRNLISRQYKELDILLSGMAETIDEGFAFLEPEEEKIVAELDKHDITPYEVSVIENAAGGCEVYLRLPPIIKHTTVEGIISAVLERPISFEKTEHGISKYRSRPRLDVETAVLQLPQDGCSVNGDSLTILRENGQLYAILADGMGSGTDAKYESASTLRLLTGFLKAGFSVSTSLGMLNSSMCLNMNNDMYSTVDLLAVNLYTGEAELYKIGSAETVINTGDEVRAISSVSAPIGILSDIKFDKKKLKLREGDIVLMMTDGITEAGYAASRTDWIKNIIIRPFDDMEKLTHEVMDTALSKSRNLAKDDMSIIAIRFIGA